MAPGRLLPFALLPTRWDAAQIRTVVELAGEDDAVFYELLHEALKPQEMEAQAPGAQRRRVPRHRMAGEDQRLVLRTGIPANRMAVATVSTLFRRARDVVSPDTRRARPASSGNVGRWTEDRAAGPGEADGG